MIGRIRRFRSIRFPALGSGCLNRQPPLLDSRFPIPYSLFPIPYSRIWTVEPGRCMVIATKPEIEAV